MTAQSIGRTMGSMVFLGRHLCLILTDLKDSDKVVLLYALVNPTGVFGNSVESISECSTEAQKQLKAMSHFMPKRAEAHPPSHSSFSCAQLCQSPCLSRRKSQSFGCIPKIQGQCNIHSHFYVSRPLTSAHAGHNEFTFDVQIRENPPLEMLSKNTQADGCSCASMSSGFASYEAASALNNRLSCFMLGTRAYCASQ